MWASLSLWRKLKRFNGHTWYGWYLEKPAPRCKFIYLLFKNNYSFKNRLLACSFFLYPFIKSDIKHSVKSDHSVILLNINSALHANRGPGFWKFNASLLEDICFVNRVHENLKTLKEKYTDLKDKHLKWDCIKCELRGITIKYSKFKTRKTREREKELNKNLNLKHN